MILENGWTAPYQVIARIQENRHVEQEINYIPVSTSQPVIQQTKQNKRMPFNILAIAFLLIYLCLRIGGRQ